MNLLAVKAILELIDSTLGDNLGKAFLSLLHQDPRFTDDQLANLDANYDDYIRMRTQLELEIEQDKANAANEPKPPQQ